MKVLLVHPEIPVTYWGFQHSVALSGAKVTLPPLGLITVAAMLPPAWEVRLVDTNTAPLSDADLRWADAVLVGGMLVQRAGIRTVLERARAQGRRTVVGGPAPTALPDAFPQADHVFVGEAEGRVETLVGVLTDPGGFPRVLRPAAEDRPSLSATPVPRFDLLRIDDYGSMSVQYSRGCPYACEFCDVTQLFGRKPRVKSPEQVLAELSALWETGYRGSVFVVDDNFIGNRREVRKLLPRVRGWQEDHRWPYEFYTEATLNLALDPGLVAGMVESGFSTVFVGIETPSTEALREARKLQNVGLDLGEAVATLTRAGLEVMSGFILGFDSDDAGIFDRQLEFVSSLPIPLAMVGLLQALPGTALWTRLQREGRLRRGSPGDPFTVPNFESRMGDALLLAGYARVLAGLYSPEQYVDRCLAFLETADDANRPGRVLRRQDVHTALRAAVRLGLLGRWKRQFWRLIARALPHGLQGLGWAVAHAVLGEHLIRYTDEDVLPRLEGTLARVRAAQACPAPQRGCPAQDDDRLTGARVGPSLAEARSEGGL